MTRTDQTIPSDSDDVFVAGDSATIIVEIVSGDGTPTDLTNKSVEFGLAEYAGGAPLVEKSTRGNGITVTDAPGGVVEVSLEPSDTDDLGQRGGWEYHFEIEVQSGPTVVTVTRGTLTIHSDTI